VTAIDTAEKLLARLDEKIAKFSLTNVDVHVMPPAPLEFRRDYFRQIFCGLGLFWQRDVEGTLREWKRVLAPGGEIGVTVFTTEAFQPYADQLCKQLASCRDHTVELPWLKLGDDRQIRAHLDTAGFTDVVITKEALGYHLPNVEAWWEVVMNSPVRILFKGLSADGLAQVRNRHLEEVRDRITGDGLWLNVPVWLVRARKPA
jgi:SAM-dependent methyltransferase